MVVNNSPDYNRKRGIFRCEEMPRLEAIYSNVALFIIKYLSHLRWMMVAVMLFRLRKCFCNTYRDTKNRILPSWIVGDGCRFSARKSHRFANYYCFLSCVLYAVNCIIVTVNSENRKTSSPVLLLCCCDRGSHCIIARRRIAGSFSVSFIDRSSSGGKVK